MIIQKADKKNIRRWAAFFVILMNVVLAAAGCQTSKMGESTENTDASFREDKQAEELTTEEIAESEGEENIVIFGVDTKAKNLSKGTRSDSLMVIHINHDEKTVKVCSIFRDTMVHIEGHGYEKITHAHSYGGPVLAMQTLNDNFDFDISTYLTVNFINVADLIDDLGGIEQDITETEVKYINNYISEINSIRKSSSPEITQSGRYTLDGTQAVAYTRIRYTAGGDYKRAERQRAVLFKIFEKAKDLGTFRRMQIAEQLFDQINTNLDRDELTSLMQYLSKYEIADADAYPKVFYGGKVDGAWVEVPITLVDMVKGLHEFLFDEKDYSPSETVEAYSNVLYEKRSTPNEDLRDQN